VSALQLALALIYGAGGFKLALPANTTGLSLSNSCVVVSVAVSFAFFMLCWFLDHPDGPEPQWSFL